MQIKCFLKYENYVSQSSLPFPNLLITTPTPLPQVFHIFDSCIYFQLTSNSLPNLKMMPAMPYLSLLDTPAIRDQISLIQISLKVLFIKQMARYGCIKKTKYKISHLPSAQLAVVTI